MFIKWLFAEPEKPYGWNGYVPITYKSLYYSNARFRESLIKMALMCAETSIDTFCYSLQDLNVLLTNVNPSIQELFDCSFIQNRHCKELDNLDWEAGLGLMVSGLDSSCPTTKII